MIIKTGARSSPLSKAQFKEIQEEVQKFHPHLILEPVWAQSPGDRDKETSLRFLGKCDFFTRDLDLMLLEGNIRIAVHSAKDLPDPIPDGLSVVALTHGVDPRDSLVLREGETLHTLKSGSRIGTSSLRREEAVRQLLSDLVFSDLRGTIGDRLSLLEQRQIDGVVIAEAALIRLNLTHLNRSFLSGETTPLQGKLAIVARADDIEMKQMFHVLG